MLPRIGLAKSYSFEWGDASGDGFTDIGDVVFLAEYIFAQGSPPWKDPIADSDCSGSIDIGDVVYLITYIFASGPSPCAECP